VLVSAFAASRPSRVDSNLLGGRLHGSDATATCRLGQKCSTDTSSRRRSAASLMSTCLQWPAVYRNMHRTRGRAVMTPSDTFPEQSRSESSKEKGCGDWLSGLRAGVDWVASEGRRAASSDAGTVVA